MIDRGLKLGMAIHEVDIHNQEVHEQALKLFPIVRDGLQFLMGFLGMLGLVQRIKSLVLWKKLSSFSNVRAGLDWVVNKLYIDRRPRLCYAQQSIRQLESDNPMNLAIEILQLLPVLLAGLNAAYNAHNNKSSFSEIVHQSIAGAASALPNGQVVPTQNTSVSTTQ